MGQSQLPGVIHYLRRLAVPAKTMTMPDAALLQRFVCEHDEAAFELLVWRHGKMVYGACRRILTDSHLAEDAFQATFLALARRASSIRANGSLGAWLHRVAYRMALHLRSDALSRASRETSLNSVTEFASITGSSADPSATAEWRDICLVLDEEVNRLRDCYRLPIVLCYFRGMSNAEAARELGCPVEAIESRLSRGRQRLRAGLTRRSLAMSAGAWTILATQAEAAPAVSTLLLSITVRGAVNYAATYAGSTVLSSQVIQLTEGVMRSMFVSKLKVAAVIVLALGIAGGGFGAWRHAAVADDQPAAKQAVQQKSGTANEKTAVSYVQGQVKKIDVAGRKITIESPMFLTALADGTLQRTDSIYLNLINQNQWLNPPANIILANPAGNVFPYPLADLRGTISSTLNPIPGVIYDPVLPHITAPYTLIPNLNTRQSLFLWHSGLAQNNLVAQAQPTDHKLAAKVEVLVDGRECKLDELTEGTTVCLTIDATGQVIRIQADGSTMNGVVESLEARKASMTIEHYENKYTYYVAKDVTVTIDGQRANVGELKKGMPVKMKFSAVRRLDIIDIQAEGPTVECILKTANSWSSTITIRLQQQHLTIPDLSLTPNAKVMIKGKEGRLDDLKAGSTISVRMTADPDKNMAVMVIQK